jgi:leukotriene-A4 hydrolase
MSMRAAACAIALVCACKGTPKDPPQPPARPPAGPEVSRDPHSHAEPDRVAVRHLALDLDVDFSARTLAGTARLSLDRRDPGARDVILDIDGLTIERVTACGGETPLAHQIGAKSRIGQPLVISLGEADCVAVTYRSAPDAGALLWVDPAGTAGGNQPMLFTQSQAILARTWIPLQDSPGVRFTYQATIRIPPGLWALMSAENPQRPPADGAWTFRMEHPIPSYLMALAVGDFAFVPIGERTGVYAEPSLVAAAAAEFAEVDAMMAAAERLYGPYRWGRYDMLVLPPSFPYGGMENPRLTFLTPTVITGDRALVALIAHELAHSWSGNLVTNSTWNDVWLNEGFTTYVERRIMEELRGKDAADVLWYLGRKDLEETLDRAGRDNPATRLALDHGRDDDPEDAPFDLPYEKGSLFLRALEQAHGRDRFDRFLRERFDRRAFQSTDSRAFEAEARAELGTAVDLASWIHEPGLPANAPPSTAARATALEQLAAAYAASGKKVEAANWSTLDWVVFLRALPDDVSPTRLAALDRAHRLTVTRNAEIAMHWLPLVIRADVRETAPAVEAFLVEVGRRRMVMPVYAALAAGRDHWRALARRAFERASPRYHAVTRDSVARVLARDQQPQP